MAHRMMLEILLGMHLPHPLPHLLVEIIQIVQTLRHPHPQIPHPHLQPPFPANPSQKITPKYSHFP